MDHTPVSRSNYSGCVIITVERYPSQSMSIGIRKYYIYIYQKQNLPPN